MLNPKSIKRKQWLPIIGGISAMLITLFLLDSHASSKHTAKSRPKKHPVHFAGVVDDTSEEGTHKSAMELHSRRLLNVEKALKSQQAVIQSLLEKLDKQQAAFNEMMNRQSRYQAENAHALQRLAQAKATLPKEKGIVSISAHYARSSIKKNPDTYVPPGSFVSATVVGGNDVTSTHSQGAMLLEINEDGHIGNDRHSPLKGCLVTASVLGDISTKCAFVYLKRLSCVKKDRPILDIPISGQVFFRGKQCIKGKPVMRNGKIKRAYRNHPVIQVGAGTSVKVVFKQGFWLSHTPNDADKPTYSRHTVFPGRSFSKPLGEVS